MVLSFLFTVLNDPRQPCRFLVRVLGGSLILGVPSGMAFEPAYLVYFLMLGFAVNSAMLAWQVTPSELLQWPGTQNRQEAEGS